jgi:hypothetical protein
MCVLVTLTHSGGHRARREQQEDILVFTAAILSGATSPFPKDIRGMITTATVIIQ